MHVDPRDRRWSELVRWLANEHKTLANLSGDFLQSIAATEVPINKFLKIV